MTVTFRKSSNGFLFHLTTPVFALLPTVAIAVLAGCGIVSAQVPVAPAKPIASAASNGVNLVWLPSSGATSYNVRRLPLTPGVYVDTKAAGFNPGVLTNTTALSYTDTTAKAGIDYLYVVNGVNAAGESSNSDHTCSARAEAGATIPSTRPRVFMAAHGTNLTNTYSNGIDTINQDPPSGDLIHATTGEWAYVATCLDGIWGNYARDYPAGSNSGDFRDETSLYNKINARNVIAEYDFPAGTTPSTLQSPTSPALTGPQTSATGPIVLNREGIEVYSDDPTFWNHLTIADMENQFVNNTSVPAWARYPEVDTGYNLNAWVKPSDAVSSLSFPGVFYVPSSLNAFNQAQGNMQECKHTCSNGAAYQQAFLNNLISTRLQNHRFILFYAVGNNPSLNTTQPQTSGLLADLQGLYNLVNTTPCSGTYYPDDAGKPYNVCPGSVTSGTGLWRRGDVIQIINYSGAYPPVPEFSNEGSAGVLPKAADSVTGMLAWLMRQ